MTTAAATKYETWDKAVLIPITDLVFTDWNANEMSEEDLAHLQAEIEDPTDQSKTRFDEPLQVVPIKGQKKWLVLGGEHRARIMKALNQDAVPCVIREDLAGKSRHELMIWSVKRNNLKGKINAQKYAELEAELIQKGGMTAEAARKSMLINGDLAKALRASAAVRENEPSDETDGSDKPKDKITEQQREAAEKAQGKDELLQALKIVEQDVLLDSADTVEHGYLFFVQGSKGQTHLVVDETKKLHSLVAKMVAACKGETTRVDDFLTAAIAAQLKSQE